jgi:acyl-CoA reductase-like NAD-dependent aldehyde dehydrogenase/nicotinamidase-related amidase
MKPLLLLVDLQEDFLDEQGIEPHRESILAGAADLLRSARAAGVPVIHVHTAVAHDPDNRMPHWKSNDRWTCLGGTPGQAPPAALAPAPGEPVLSKNGFGVGSEAFLRLPELKEARHAVVAGVHVHACVRQAALDLHQAGIAVCIARDATGSHEPAHAAQSEAYLRSRGIAFEDNAAIRTWLETGVRSAANLRARGEIAQSLSNARPPAGTVAGRTEILLKAAGEVAARSEMLAQDIVSEIGKPIRYARGEVHRISALFRAVAARAAAQELDTDEPEATVRRRPVGNVAIISPWNNPLAIAAGQIAPAFLYGNAIVWKPAPAGSRCAERFHQMLCSSGIEADSFRLIQGDGDVGFELARHAGIDAVCFTGATGTGRVVAAAAAQRHLPVQAELGGNNAAIVTSSADLERAALLVAEAAFGCAGQRCTATRRVIILDEVWDNFLPVLERAVEKLVWGEAHLEATQVGPLVNEGHARNVAAAIARADDSGFEVRQPHRRTTSMKGPRFIPPTMIHCSDPNAEIVQEETFGPVLIIQRAASLAEALDLLNTVRQGLAGALFSARPDEQELFLSAAKCGILKLNLATVEAGVDVPFLGWKASGIGLPQHGESNRLFFTRLQSVYR